MAIYDFFLSRNSSTITANTYIGHEGRLFYDDTNGVVKLSDGVTPGGLSIPYTIATETTVGGIKAGPGANVSLDGTLTIDTTGIPLSIGNLQILDTEIKTTQANVDMYLVANGTGNVNLIGQVNFYKPNGFPPTGEPFFRAKNDGQLRILVPAEDPIEGGVEIIGSASGNYIAPGAPGAMLQVTGNPSIPARIYLDGNAEYASFVARRYNGNVAVPTQVLANQDILRINATAATTSGVGNVALAQIRVTALENQTPTAQGSSITFTVTPVGSAASSRVDVANITVANGVSATKFTTTGTVSAGNYNGTARNAGTLGAAGTLTIDFATDHNVLVNLTTTATIAFSNITAGKTVTVLLKNDTGANRTITTGVLDINTSGGDATPNVNDQRTGVLVYRTFGTATTDIYCEVNP